MKVFESELLCTCIHFNAKLATSPHGTGQDCECVVVLQGWKEVLRIWERRVGFSSVSLAGDGRAAPAGMESSAQCLFWLWDAINLLVRVTGFSLQYKPSGGRKTAEGLEKGRVPQSSGCSITWWSHLEKQVKKLETKGARLSSLKSQGKWCSVVVSWQWSGLHSRSKGLEAFTATP